MNGKVKDRQIEWLSQWLFTNFVPNPKVVQAGVTVSSMAKQAVMALEDIEVDELMKWEDVHRNDPTPF